MGEDRFRSAISPISRIKKNGAPIPPTFWEPATRPVISNFPTLLQTHRGL